VSTWRRSLFMLMITDFMFFEDQEFW